MTEQIEPETLRVASLTAMHTPGHTDGSTCYIVNETAAFTGDTLFTNGVGRPDLHADPDAAVSERVRCSPRSAACDGWHLTS